MHSASAVLRFAGLADQLDSAEPFLESCGWCDAAQRSAIRALVEHVPTGGKPERLSAFLVTQKLATRAQAADLDTVVDHQRYFPDFRLLRKLGAGGMGTVFLAEVINGVHAGRTVALKTLNPRLAVEGDFVQRFHREAETLAAVDHPNIARVVSSGDSKGHLYLALEFIEGPNLLELLKQNKRFPEAYALRIMAQVVDGLNQVWSQAGIVHRDIKPENILVVRDPAATDPFPVSDQARLIDFGLVKPTTANDEERARLTQSGMTIGTPLYMAPEQIRGETLDCRCDMYAVGATLYHLVTGTVPFSGTSPGAIMSAHLTERVPDPGRKAPELSQPCREMIMRCMAKFADERYLDLADLYRSIVEIRDGTANLRFLKKPMPKKAGSGLRPSIPSERNERTADPRVTSQVHLPPLPMMPASDSLPVNNQQPERSEPRPAGQARRTPLPVGGMNAAKVANGIEPTPLRNQQLNRSTPTPLPGAPSAPHAPTPTVPHPVAIAPMCGIDLPKVAPSTARSKVFDEDTHSGVGILPWMILGGAIIALAGFLIFRAI